MPKKSVTNEQHVPLYDSENSDGESEKCPICLLPFRNQEVANPASCEHCFCLDCIMEWSKNVNTCPVDRQSFSVINVRTKIGGKVNQSLKKDF
jgi:PHD and RING finger domain-containing protein 1